MTANVNLWPHTVALIANPDTLADLTPTQRGWVERAGADAASQSTDLTDDDAELLLELCAGGTRFANASDADLTAMRAAFAPHYTHLEADVTTRGYIEQIETMKPSIDPGAGTGHPAGMHRRGGRDADPGRVVDGRGGGGDVARWYVPVDDHGR